MSAITKTLLATCVLAALGAAGGCTTTPAGPTGPMQPGMPTPPELTTIENMTSHGQPKSVGDTLRPAAIRQAAMELGVQSGTRWRYEQIDSELETLKGYLDRIFDFGPLMLDEGRVVPPVIVQVDGAYNQDSDVEATQVLTAFSILHQARLSTLPPSWRDYLIHHYAVDGDVNPILLPQNDAERAIWTQATKQGWDSGVRNADDVYEADLNRLHTDYVGMLTFRLLAAEGMVSVPAFAEGHAQVAVDGQTLAIDQRVFRITAPTMFLTTLSRWKALAAPRKPTDPDSSREP